MKYRRKPLVVEAMRWHGPEDNPALREFAGHWVSIANAGESVILMTPTGHTPVRPGDYIFRVKENEFYVCNAEFFERHYEEAKP